MQKYTVHTYVAYNVKNAKNQACTPDSNKALRSYMANCLEFSVKMESELE